MSQDSEQRRKFYRWDTHLILCHWFLRGQWCEGELLNLSFGGALIFTAGPVPESGSIVKLTLHMLTPEVEYSIRLEAIVREFHHTSEGAQINVEFLNDYKEKKEKLLPLFTEVFASLKSKKAQGRHTLPFPRQ